MTPNADMVRQIWPLDGGRLVLMLETETPAKAEQYHAFARIVEAVEASGLLSPRRGK